uniref:CSN8/PSMD8/EIF3K domain-containing protein n=1 Tax=Phaeomonas parva TaxID=124430 RepID=A0A7S1TVL6_9STRA|mmetsp:Transcript_17648/g.54022  ORF Transcript_17648/g.54022 Transcript_17648/m.54022 type:complete len:235 (+) Transcript_17648:248-952(+)
MTVGDWVIVAKPTMASFLPENAGDMAAFLETARYSSSSIPQLEAYLDEQVASGTHDFEANLALLKLYLMFPEAQDVARIGMILKKAVAALPEPLLLQCRYLVPKALIKAQDDVAKTISLGKLIEGGRYEQFWTEGGEEFCDSMTGLRQGVSNAILGCMARGYTSIQVDRVAAALNVSEAEIPAALEASPVEGEIRDGALKFTATERTRKQNNDTTSELQSVNTLLKELMPLARV